MRHLTGGGACVRTWLQSITGMGELITFIGKDQEMPSGLRAVFSHYFVMHWLLHYSAEGNSVDSFEF